MLVDEVVKEDWGGKTEVVKVRVSEKGGQRCCGSGLGSCWRSIG